MFGRQVTLKLKADSATDLIRINAAEILPILRKQKGFRDQAFIAPGRSEAIAKQLLGYEGRCARVRSYGMPRSVQDSFPCDRRNAVGKNLRVCLFDVPPGYCFQVDVRPDRRSPGGGAGNVRLSPQMPGSANLQSFEKT